MADILVVYHQAEYPPRATIYDHLYSLHKYSGHRCHHLNLAVGKVPGFVRQARFDLVVYHTTFLSTRWNPAVFRRMMERAEPLRGLGERVAAFPQDEFIHTRVLGEFIEHFGVDHVFSVAPESEWSKIYPSVDPAKVRFTRVLTGYLDDETVARIDRLARSVPERTIDVGYRAWRAAAWLGRQGLPKAEMAEVFNREAPAELTVDVSTRAEDTLFGDDWYRFLLRCKYVIGVEGGASILDPDGAIKQRTEEFVARNPTAGFEEIERACFPGLDGNLNFPPISPRHLEACATRTCQVLMEGEYNGILEPGKHFIELRRNYSNLGEVFDALRDDVTRERITEAAYRDIVESGRYAYRGFVENVLSELGLPHTEASRSQAMLHRRMRVVDAVAWRKVKFLSRVQPAVGWAVDHVKPRVPRALWSVVRHAWPG
jgi:hypothetical protein